MNTATQPTCTFTKWNDQWAIRSTEKLGADNTIDGKFDIYENVKVSIPGFVMVTLKSGATKKVKVGELEKSFGDAHIYSITNA
jgi:hypothetical protein